MTTSALTYKVPTDTAGVADLRATAHGAGTAARIALLLFAAELALETLPPGPWRDEGSRALILAARVPAGKPVEASAIVETMQNEQDEGPLVYLQLMPSGPQARAWAAVAQALGYAAWHECQRTGEHPSSLIEGYVSPDSLDFCIDSFVGVPDLDWTALGQATRWVREHASKADEGWGTPLRIEDLRRVASH